MGRPLKLGIDGQHQSGSYSHLAVVGAAPAATVVAPVALVGQADKDTLWSCCMPLCC